MELVTGAGLAFSAGLNAYVPLLILGLSARFFSVVHLPAAWSWLSNPWVLVILGVLLVIEIIADKIPVVDSVNNVIQTFVRPAAGGIVFGSSSGSTTTLVSDPAKFFTTGAWIPVAVGVLIALASHAGKSVARPVLNAASFGAAAPVVSTVEDVSSIGLSVFAIVMPIVALILIAVGITVFVIVIRRARRRMRERAAAGLDRRRMKALRRQHPEPVPPPPGAVVDVAARSTRPPAPDPHAVTALSNPELPPSTSSGEQIPAPPRTEQGKPGARIMDTVQARMRGAASGVGARVKAFRRP